jgi:hypothetical protein
VDPQPLAPGQPVVVPVEPGPAYLEAGTYTLRVLVTIVRGKDEERWGEYRTKRMVLEAYGELESLKH